MDAGNGVDRPVDFRDVAAETPGESIAYENEIVEQLARDDQHREQPARQSVQDQLAGLVDAAKIRSLPDPAHVVDAVERRLGPVPGRSGVAPVAPELGEACT